jgi:hypothetical protein
MKRSLITTIYLGAIAIAAIGVLVGCGGAGDNGSSDTTITTSSHTKAEFIKLADGICKRERERVIAEFAAYVQQHEGKGKAKPEVINDAFATVVLPEIKHQIEEIRSLGAPKGDEQQVEELLSSLQEAVDAGNRFVAGDFKRSARLARAYGLESCAYVN